MPETPSQLQPRPKDGERVSKLEDAWASALRRIPTPYCLQADKPRAVAPHLVAVDAS
jgi:hypothetical protein